MKRRIVIGILVLAAVALISGASLLALATPGSADDPYITISYLTETFRTQIMKEVDDTSAKLTEGFDAKIKLLETQLQSTNPASPQEPGNADRFSVVTLTRGQSLTCSVGTELMLRVGTANAKGTTSPALVNYTSAESIASGTTLITNNMYLVTIEGNGVTATADTVRLMVRGDYKVS